MPALADVAAFIGEVVDAGAFPDEPTTRFIPSDREVRRLGLALEPGPGLAEWVDAERLDAVFLHRPWGVEDARLPADTGVLASHAPFDHRLTIGANPDLARELGIRDPQPLGEKEGRVIGMIGSVKAEDAAELIDRIARLFGGMDQVVRERTSIRRIAVVGAMTDALVREAAARGADLYLTGQMRQPGLRAAADMGIGVAAVGHGRSEMYGLRLLAEMIQGRFAGRIVCILDPRGTGPAGRDRQSDTPPAPIRP